MAGRFDIETIFSVKDKMTAPVNKIRTRINQMTRGADANFRKLNQRIEQTNESLKKWATAAFAGGAAVAGGFGLLIHEASKIEDAVAAFTPLLGGVENATKAVDMLNETAATTPFQFEQLSSAANTLLGFGAATLDTLVPTLRMLGDTAGGSSEKLESIALAFSKIKAAGKADMQDLNMLIDAGIPIFAELEKITGKNTAQLRKMSSQGKISSALIEKAFKGMTSEGGKFFNGMQIASETQSGLMSTLKDNLSLTAAAIGAELLPTTKDLTKQAIEITGSMRAWVGQNKELIREKVGNVVKFISDNMENFKMILFAVIGFLKIYLPLIAAVKIATFAWNTAVLAGQVLLWGWKAAIFAVQAMMVAFNAVMFIGQGVMWAFGLASNLAAAPIWLIVAAIAAVVAAGYLLVKNWEPIKDFFVNLWAGILEVFNAGVSKIQAILGFITDPVKKLFGGVGGIAKSLGIDFTGSGNDGGDAGKVVTSNEQISKSISENKDSLDINLNDSTGKAEVVKMPALGNVGVNLAKSGAF